MLTNFDKEQFCISAEELRQFFFCQRKIIFRHIHHIRPNQSYLMQKGTNFHQSVVYASPNNPDTKSILKKVAPPTPTTIQYHDVELHSKKIHLMARLDLFEKEGEDIYPVEIKTGVKPTKTHILQHFIQITAQALLLEERFNTAVTKGRIIYLGDNQSEWIEITIDLKEKVLKAIDKIMQLMEDEEMPPPTPYAENCTACEMFFACKRA